MFFHIRESQTQNSRSIFAGASGDEFEPEWQAVVAAIGFPFIKGTEKRRLLLKIRIAASLDTMRTTSYFSKQGVQVHEALQTCRLVFPYRFDHGLAVHGTRYPERSFARRCPFRQILHRYRHAQRRPPCAQRAARQRRSAL